MQKPPADISTDGHLVLFGFFGCWVFWTFNKHVSPKCQKKARQPPKLNPQSLKRGPQCPAPSVRSLAPNFQKGPSTSNSEPWASQNPKRPKKGPNVQTPKSPNPRTSKTPECPKPPHVQIPRLSKKPQGPKLNPKLPKGSGRTHNVMY